jgi:hypothetical protein
MNQKYKPFYFIGNIIESDIKSPILLKYGYEIKRASSDQIKVIKTKFEKVYEAAQLFWLNINPYECEFIYTGDVNSGTIESLQNIDQWKYWILELDCSIDEYEKQNDLIKKNIQIIDSAFLLSDFNIQLLWGFLHYRVKESDVSISAISGQDFRPLNYFKSTKNINPKTTKINSNFVNEINQLVTQIEQIFDNERHNQLQKVINDLVSYFEIPPKSPYRIIGLFAIFEHLLTANESGNSINKQLQTKLNLLNNRFSKKLDIYKFFKLSSGFKFEIIIDKLYSYRSDIAHGNPIDFKNKLQVLNNIELVEDFLLTLAKRTIKQALYEPDLIHDLKKC